MSAYPTLMAELRGGATVVIDGATGTELERRGTAMHDRAWCAMATLTAPDTLCAVHEDYIRAGARVITTNTFSTNRNMLEPAGLGDRFEALNREAVRIARLARQRCGAGAEVVVAGSMSHQVPIERHADARIVRAVPPPAVAGARFAEMAAVLADAGAELLLLEMMYDPVLANAAIDAARATGLPLWVGFSVRAGADGRPFAYADPGMEAGGLYDAVALDGVDVAGVMHSDVTVTAAALEQLRARWPGPMMAYPDSGFFRMPHWHFESVIPPLDLVEHAARWRAAGVQVLGGCCGLGVEHIEALCASITAR